MRPRPNEVDDDLMRFGVNVPRARARSAIVFAVAALVSLASLAADEPARPEGNTRFIQLDITYVLHRRHDSSPYYNGQPLDYRWLKPGACRAKATADGPEVPFTIVDPVANGGSSVAMTGSDRNRFPNVIRVYPYARGVKKVYLLGMAAGWGFRPRGMLLGRLRFRYSDGSRIERPLRSGYEIDDWTRHGAANVAVAFSERPGGEGLHVDVLGVELPDKSGAVLAEIAIDGAAGLASIPLFAVTLEVEQDYQLAPDRAAIAADLSADCSMLKRRIEAISVPSFRKQASEQAGPLLARAAALSADANAELTDVFRARTDLLRAWDELLPLTYKRVFAKKPDASRPAFPDCSDYMIFLERFPAWAERGWHDYFDLEDPDLGYFGQGGNAENSLRTLGSFIFAYSLLASEDSYDESVSGVSRQKLLARARSAIRYMTRSHVTGDMECANGRKWGNHWQSAWWTTRMLAGAALIWDSLTPQEKAGVRRVAVFEADRHLKRKAPGGEFANTRAEENAWDSEILAWAACLWPDHEHAKAWDAKAREFFMNSLSVAADRDDDSVVDGKPIKEWVYTANVHPDFTIENHGAYQFCYMASPLQSLTWAYYAYVSTGRTPPQSLFHHFRDVWNVARRTHLYDGRFAYLGGKDWARYVYGLYFIVPAAVMLQNEFGDNDARMIEALRFRTFEWEQRLHSDGGVFTGRFTNNLMRGWPSEYEADCAAMLGLSYLLHKGRRLVKPAEPVDFQRRMAGVLSSSGCEWTLARSERAFASFSWRMLDGRHSMGLFVPAGCDHMAEWGANNLIGSFSVRDYDLGGREVEHSEVLSGHAFSTTGRIKWGLSDKGSAIHQHLSFSAAPVAGAAILFDCATAGADVTVTEQSGLCLQLANDIFNGNRRRLTWQGGQAVVQGVGGGTKDVSGRSAWLNVDGKFGIVCFGSDSFTLRDKESRNAPWGSLLCERIDWPHVAEKRDYKRDETVRDLCFVFLACGEEGTERCAASSRLLRVQTPLCRGLWLETSDGARAIVVANLGDSARTVRFSVPPDRVDDVRGAGIGGIEIAADGTAKVRLDRFSSVGVELPRAR